MTLVIMAAGMGSRFGGMKQIEPVGPNGEFIIDYSIYDAIRVGFKKVVFIIKEENYDIFRETIGKRIEDKISVEYVFQSNDNIPKNIEIPEERVKPFGTAHAILCCKGVVNEPFTIINADDFYGYDAYKVIADFMKKNDSDSKYAMAGYITGNTLSENGSVKRGVCKQEGKYLSEIVESSVETVNGKIIATPLDGSKPFEVNDDTLVSMNMFSFTPKILTYLEERFPKFLEENKDDLLKCEFLIPVEAFNQVKLGEATIEVLKTTAKWQGITYKEDKELIVKGINELIEKGEYPRKLWD